MKWAFNFGETTNKKTGQPGFVMIIYKMCQLPWSSFSSLMALASKLAS
ncbi:MAG TPA: hypothetical protein VLL95_01890 [Phnomibacter sp.]|nr:hypothetical protein [Phnomibacter sp.]